MNSEAPLRQGPTRDDCWTQDASATLVDAWGRRYLDLNRGNLRQKDWQEVAEEVNSLHGHSKKTRRTDVQCKNRIDTLKKKYKVEKMKIAESDGTRMSSWPFFSKMDFLIGSTSTKPQSKPNFSTPSSAGSQPTPILSLPSPPMALPLPYDRGLPPPMATPVVMPQKRPLSSPALDGSYSLRNYSAMAAAAAAAAEDEDGDTDGEEEGSEDGDVQGEESWVQGMRKVAEAVEKIGEIFERVEKKKQKLILDLEKQRMLFIQDLEVRRMQWFTDTLAQQQKKKLPKRSGSSDAGGYGFADAYQ